MPSTEIPNPKSDFFFEHLSRRRLPFAIEDLLELQLMLWGSSQMGE